MKKYTVTIGIPAYNEENNIKHLLKDLLRQRVSSYVLEEILVASDGSTDKTDSIVEKVKDTRVVLLSNARRQGKAARENDIIARAKGDILVFLDADTVISDRLFIEEIITPILKGEADMTSGAIEPLPAKGFFERVLEVSMKLKTILFESYHGANNVNTCNGPVRAMTKKLYKRIHFELNDGEDMYSYYACKSFGARFVYTKRTVIRYRLPTTLRDHLKQSLRYRSAQKQVTDYFDPAMVAHEQIIPKSAYLIAGVKALPIIVMNPVHVLIYVLLLASIKLNVYGNWRLGDSWRVASSKTVRA